jgi:hypothetical protein
MTRVFWKSIKDKVFFHSSLCSFFFSFFGYCITFVLIFHSLYIPLWSWISSTLILVSLIVMPPMIQLQLNVLKPLLGIISLSFPLIAHSFFFLTFFF